MKHWLRDASFRGLLRNSGYMAVSRIAAGLLALGALSLTTHSLGASVFGLLILIHSYALTASGLVKFQSWQMVIRYGAPALKSGNVDQLRHGISFALGLDITSGIFGMLAAMALLPLVAPWLHIGSDELPLAILYCLLLPTMAAATPSGVLRLLDRFDLLSLQALVNPALRLGLTGAAWALDWPFPAFLLIWFVTDLAGDLMLWALALRELHKRNLLKGLRPGLQRHARHLVGSWRFALTTNLTTSLSAAWGPVANLLVGILLSPAAAGQYRVAAGLVEAANKPADMLAKAFYPEVMRMDLESRKPWKLMVRGAILSGGLGLLIVAAVLIGGPGLLGTLFGREFEPAFELLMLMLAGLMLTMIAFPLGPMLYAVDKAGVPLRARMVSAAVYLAAIYPATQWLGLTGAGLAYIGAMLLLVIQMVPPLHSEFRRRTRRAAQHAG
jgi:O-antigen/teichoic acid export membrane protein